MKYLSLTKLPYWKGFGESNYQKINDCWVRKSYWGREHQGRFFESVLVHDPDTEYDVNCVQITWNVIELGHNDEMVTPAESVDSVDAEVLMKLWNGRTQKLKERGG